MVKAVNENEVSPEEQLGNRVLYYDAMSAQLEVAYDLDREKDHEIKFDRQ